MATLTEPLLDQRELAAWRGLLIAHSKVIATLDEELYREHRLPLNSYEVLLHLSGAGDQSLRMGALADRLVISRSGLTRLIDRLVDRGLVERHSCPSDRRGTCARLTDEGIRRFEEARPTHLRGIREHFLAHLSDTDLDRLAAVWEKIPDPAPS